MVDKNYRSMTDLDQNPSTQSPRRKFSFRFPNLSHSISHDRDGSSLTSGGNNNLGNHQHGINYVGKDKRNFSEEAKNVPDLQVSSVVFQLFSTLLVLVELMIASFSLESVVNLNKSFWGRKIILKPTQTLLLCTILT